MRRFSFVVTALGFKPKTFSSVVRCSIQLSYAAILFSECKDTKTDYFYKYFFRNRKQGFHEYRNMVDWQGK